MSVLSGVRPTKGYLIEMKKRLSFIERGCEFLKLKRDHLAKELSRSLEVLRGQRKSLNEQLTGVYAAVSEAYLSLGPVEVESQASSIRERIELEVLPLSTMGVLHPAVKIRSRPPTSVELDISLVQSTEKLQSLLEYLIDVSELEATVERIADELGKTSRKVNALENIVIPSYSQVIKFIEDKIDEEALEELVRTKLVGGAIARRIARTE